MRADVVVVGAGFAGSVLAERLATAGRRVILIEKRDHIGGNSYDVADSHGILIHPYGPHIFHTNATHVFDYLSRFTEWRTYEHRVLAHVNGQLLPFPINQDTINQLYGLNLDERGIADYLARVREPRARILTSEDLVLNSIGKDLCDIFFRNYTRKQWGLDLCDLAPNVASRIPVRTSRDDRYFTDKYQIMPRDGYTRLFERMLHHPRIQVELATDFHNLRRTLEANLTVYTGPIDAYFNFSLGRLPYRSLRFDYEHFVGADRYQPVATVNFPNDNDFTRITEFKHLTAQSCSDTTIAREYPMSDGEPFYPIPRPVNYVLFKEYSARASAETNVMFVGRLAQYRYYNMDQSVAAALKLANVLCGV